LTYYNNLTKQKIEHQRRKRRIIVSVFRYWVKITRPTQCLLGGLAAWTVALLSDGPTWFTPEKIAAGVVIMLSVLAASVWHYGARADVYARKHWDPVFVKKPRILMCAGAGIFLASIVIAGIFLPMACVMIAILNAVIIMLYAKILDQHWPFKNLSIAVVCVTPLILGWFSGHRFNPIVPSLILATFFVYLAREIFKDVVDREANQGYRFTMVMDLGTVATVRIGGIALTTAIFFILHSLRFAPTSLLVWILSISGTIWLSWFAVKSLLGENIAPRFSWMDVGTATILLSLLGARFSMY
jgi:4-hydroxybenzoate polyprenyltransferase